MGRVSAIPTTTDTIIPMRNGWSSVAHMMRFPTHIAACPSGGAISHEKNTPTPIVTSGVTSISTFVSFDTALPISAAIIAMKSTASGPPAPPSVLAAKPTVIIENSTSGGHLRAYPIATAMAGPHIAIARPPTVYGIFISPTTSVHTGFVRNPTPNCVPIVFMIVPIRSEQNRPCAMAPRASIPYLLREISMSFFAMNSFALLIFFFYLLFPIFFKV